MADPVARDRQVEQLLRRVLVARPTTECVDAEQLAAWADGGLPAPQAAVVERHLGDCSDCQAMLAAFVASEPPASAPVPFWHRWRLQWLVPIAAASVVVFAWTMVSREPGDASAPSTTMARVEPAEAPALESGAPFVPASGSGASQSVRPDTAVVPELAERGMTAMTAPLDQAPASSADEPAVMAEPVVGTQERSISVVAPAPSVVASGARALPAAAPPSPPAATRASQAAPPSPPAPVVSAAARSGVAVPAAGSAEQAPAMSGQRSFSGAAPQGQLMMEAAAASAAGAFPVHARVENSEPVDFRAPAGETRVTVGGALTTTWRIGPDGRVRMSNDAGQTWSVVPLDPALFITAGSAPVEGVCWLIDRGGAVLRATNGADFQRTAFSAPDVPVSVLAVDANQATVVTDGGGVFMTTNGGATWTQMP